MHSYVCKPDSEYDPGRRRARSVTEHKEAQVAGPLGTAIVREATLAWDLVSATNAH